MVISLYYVNTNEANCPTYPKIRERPIVHKRNVNLEISFLDLDEK